MLKKIGKIFGRFITVLLVTVLGVVIFTLGVLLVVFKGPSPTSSDILVLSLKETSALKWLPGLFFTDEEINDIEERNTIKITGQTTDTDLINVDIENQEGPEIEVKDITGSTYKGKVMIIKDPSKVFVGTKGVYDESPGMTALDIATRYDAKASINGGGFYDVGGQGNGGLPEGYVISEGEFVYGSKTSEYITLGFTEDNKLVVGVMNGQEALNMKMRDAVCVAGIYAPPLIINGEAQEVQGIGGGLNPRTAIGQREDGAVILVVVDGRQANSLGASFSDMIEIMQENGAVNAGSLDGGSSTQMSCDGEVLNSPYPLYGARKVPSAFVVR